MSFEDSEKASTVTLQQHYNFVGFAPIF
ncbi:hypothetical protein, partial [Escherichia coli]